MFSLVSFKAISGKKYTQSFDFIPPTGGKTIEPKIEFKSLKHSHKDLYLQIVSKPISNIVVKSRFGPNWFEIDL